MLNDAARSLPARFPALHGVRAAAAVGVVAFHVHQGTHSSFGPAGRFVAHLNVGVSLFFLLSGFLLYRPFVLARGQHRVIATGTYVARRFARIVPAYWLALCALAIWPGVHGFFSGSWLASAAFLQIYARDWNGTGLDVAWSLCAEVSFYLALPLYARMMDRLAGGGTRRALPVELGVLAAVAVGSLVAHTMLHSSADGDLSMTLPGTAYLFCAGMLLAVCSVHTESRLSAVLHRLGRRRALCWLGAAAVFAAIGLYYSSGATGPTQPWNALYAPVAFLMLLPLTLAPSRTARLDRLLSSRAAVALGTISYGIYLWHSSLIGELASLSGGFGRLGDGLGLFVLTLTAACLAASASYLVLERPLLRRVRHRAPARAKPRTEHAPSVDGASVTTAA
jgi:peptidoglycan/LPS O-acetylase OafA/YrhL